MTFDLQCVHYMPAELKPGVLYVSKEFGTAAHLCACGCNSKIRTPLGPTEWTLEETDNVPTLTPSIGNWQLPCQSHYLITKGKVIWAPKWTPEQIAFGRKTEEERRRAYYEALDRNQNRILQKFWRWVKNLVRRVPGE